MEARGKTLIKVVSIFLVIGGVLGILGGILILTTGGLVLVGGGIQDNYLAAGAVTAVGGLLIGYAVYSIAYAVVVLVAAVSGIKNCAKPEEAGKLFKLGIILLVLCAVSFVWGILANGFKISSLFGFLFPVLYLVGANMNKQGSQQEAM